MNKLKYIRVQEQDNSYSNDIPIGVDAQNVDMRNGNTLQDTIGNLDITVDDNITEQLSQLHQDINQLDTNKLNKSDVNNYVPSVVTGWLNNNVTPVGSAVTIDKSLSIEGSAADAKIVGDELTDLKNSLVSLSDITLIDKFIDADIEHKVTWEKVKQNINVGNTGYVTIYPSTPILLNCVPNEEFTVFAKVKTSVSQDYKYVVRLRKYTQSGGTGTYYSSAEFTDSVASTIVLTADDVTQVELQFARAYIGSETSNFRETFDIEYFIAIRGKISLFNDSLAVVADDLIAVENGLASKNLTYNNLLNAEVLREDVYYEYTAKTTSTWQGNLPATRVEVQENDVLILGISDWYGVGTSVIGFNIYDSSDTHLKNWSITLSQLDENRSYVGRFIMPANTSYAIIVPYVISGGEPPTAGVTYHYRNAIIIKGSASLSEIVQVGSSNISDSAVTLAKLQDNVKPYSIALRYGTKYPNVDTDGQTITFYSGTCIFDTLGHEIFRSTEAIVVNFYQSAQQNRIVFDRDNQTFLALPPGTTVNNDRYIVLGIITRAGSDAYSAGRGWLGIPHTINGYDPYIKQLNPMWDLPNNWSDKVQAIQTAQGTNFTFAVQTDTHCTLDMDEYHGNNLKALTNHVGFDFVANLGDVIRGYADETLDSPENMRAALTQIMHRYVTGISCPFMVAMGNHESNSMWVNAFGGEKFSNAELWGRMFRPSFNTNPKAVTQTGKMYYYTDFNDVRVIVLNTQDGTDQGFGIGSEQLSWFTNTALNTDKWVLVMSHVPLVNGWSVSSNYVSSYANIVNALKSFKTNGGKVIGCMYGHTHTQETQTVDGILHITFRNTAGLAEVVMVDLENKIINTVMCGTSGTRSFTFT